MDGAGVTLARRRIKNESISELNARRLTVNSRADFNVFKGENLKLEVPAGKLHT